MGPESKFWRESVKPNAVGRWLRIESPVSLGVPDCVVLVRGVTSWVELKAIEQFDEGLGTSRKQRHWLRTWNKEGGRAYLLARVGAEVLFLDGSDIPDYLRPEEWRALSLLHGPRLSFNWDRMADIMSN